MQKNVRLILRQLELGDIEEYRKWTHPSREYHKYNGPYFKQSTPQEHETYINALKHKLESGEKNVLDSQHGPAIRV